jgi:uncharacterized protein (DUF1778 family)
MSYTMEETTHNSVLSVRVSAAERVLLEGAASQARTTLSDFVRRKAVEAAEIEVLDRRSIAIPAKDWEAFEAWVDSPAKEIRGLQDLAGRTPTWWK